MFANQMRVQLARKCERSLNRSFVALATLRSTPLAFDVDVTSLHKAKHGFNFYMPREAPVPEKLHKYQYHERDLVGEGFFAKVYRATESLTQNKVALKVIDKSSCPKEVYNQEIKIMADIKQKLTPEERVGLGVCNDVMEKGNKICLAFDLGKGDLFDEIVDNGSLNESEAKALMTTMLTSLSNLHSKGFLHRDVKLENVLLPEGSCSSREEMLSNSCLTDFGYAKRVEDKDKFRNPAGTFGYVAPEVLSKLSYSDKCDVWSCGAVLFTCLAQYQPFPYKTSSNNQIEPNSGNTIKRELEAIQHGMQLNIWEKEMSKPAFSKLSPELKDLLRGMLEPNPEDRLSAEEALAHPWFSEECDIMC